MDPIFQQVEAAITRGDTDAVISFLMANPVLAITQSSCSHPTILQCLVLTQPPVPSQERVIQLLASQGAELNDPLIAAASMNNLSAIDQLLDLGANIEGNGLWSPLEEALYWNHEAAVNRLLERGAPIRFLRVAAGLGNIEWMKRCFDGDKLNVEVAGKVSWPFFKHPIPEAVRTDSKQITGNALVYAAAWGRTEAVAFLLAHGADVNMIPAGFDYSGTALHYAALEGRDKMVEQLLSAGADPSIKDTKIGALAEGWAEHGGHQDLCESLRAIRTKS